MKKSRAVQMYELRGIVFYSSLVGTLRYLL